MTRLSQSATWMGFAAAMGAIAVVALASPASADDGSHPARKRHRVARAVAVGRGAGHDAGVEGHARGGAKHRVPEERAESIGSPNDGRLKGGVHLDLTRPYLRVVPAYESGDMRWGLPSLIHMIDRAARDVHRKFPGSVLGVGDISQRGGGDIRHHHSHESGRDADIAFYVVDAKGKQIQSHGLVKFDASLTAPAVAGARFDLPRNWALVQDLLTDPVARVSHVFIAEWLRHELLAYARPRVSHALWERAALALMQPHGSLPHDDHMHVRISCPREDRGCVEIARPHGAAPLAHGHPHLAHRSDPGGHALRTPGHAASHAAPAGPVAPIVIAPSEDPLPSLDILDD